MTVVTDTSVILNLCLLGLEDVLTDLFGEVQAPPAVAKEFARLASTDPRFVSLVFPGFIAVHAPSHIHPLLALPRLHQGEREALSLASEIHASLVLMDERAGRAVATDLGLRSIGLLGILIDAKRKGLVAELAPHLDRLQHEARFWFSASLRFQVLQLAGEVP